MTKRGGKRGGKDLKGAIINYMFDHRKNPNGVYTVHWYIRHEGTKRPFSTGIKLSEDDVAWLKENKAEPDGRLKDPYRRNLWNMLWGETYRDGTDEFESLYVQAENVIDKMESFSFDRFKDGINRYGEPDSEPAPEIQDRKASTEDDLLIYLKSEADRYDKNGQIGSANSHRDTRSSLRRFLEYLETGNEPEDAEKEYILPFGMITVRFLGEYEGWMLQYGKASKAKRNRRNLKDQEINPQKYLPRPASEQTVGIYSRYIRKGLLFAKSKGIITEEQYPFTGDGKYVIAEVENVARALPFEDVEKVMSYKTDDDNDQRAASLWVFSYLGNGLNMKDICMLKKENYMRKLKTITFFREKTKNTSKGSKMEIRIDLFPQAIEIIERWGAKDPDNPYLFPLLVADRKVDEKGVKSYTVTAKQIKSIVNQVTKITNKSLDRISEELGLAFSLRTNDARDTQATRLAESGADLLFIQRNQGHHDPKTTTRYIRRLPLESAKKIREGLLPGKGKK